MMSKAFNCDYWKDQEFGDAVVMDLICGDRMSVSNIVGCEPLSVECRAM